MTSEAAFLRQRALSFGSDADLYDQARPGYPAALFAHLAGRLSGPRVLEVGAGTGKATAGLASAGLDVTCIEPDPEMAAVLARRTAGEPRVRVEVAAFESVAVAEAYDGLVSAQAWHWTDPLTRMDRAAALLRPGGFLGLFWNASVIRPPHAYCAIQAVYDDFGLHGPGRPGEPAPSEAALAEILDPATWPGDEIAAHPAFEYQGTSLFPWRRDYTAVEFGEFLGSTSWFRILQPEIRTRLLAAITGMLHERFGGVIGLDWVAQCYNAQRVG
jgi:SAM-dependent methyltransferase